MATSFDNQSSGNEILSSEDLKALTGYSRSKNQQHWLASAGIWFKPDRAGRPSTTWYHVNHPMIAHQSADTSRIEPDFEAM